MAPGAEPEPACASGPASAVTPGHLGFSQSATRSRVDSGLHFVAWPFGTFEPGASIQQKPNCFWGRLAEEEEEE